MRNHEAKAGFEDTNWSLIREIRSDDPVRRRAALESLVSSYTGPVYSYLRHLGCDPEHAGELTQSFFVRKVLDEGLFEKAERGRARLRVLIQVALRHFRIDDRRQEVARGAGLKVSLFRLDKEERAIPTPQRRSPEDAFHRRWASVVLEEALERCRRYYVSRGKQKEWEAFYARTVRPIISGAKPPPQVQVAEDIGFQSPAAVAQANFEIRRRMQFFLHEVVAETIDEPSQVMEEMHELFGAAPKA